MGADIYQAILQNGGDFLRRLRVQEIAKSKGFSMASLQRTAHLDRNTAQRVWRNTLYGAHPATLEKTAKALGVLPSELIIEDSESAQEDEVVTSPWLEHKSHL